ncbi:MAG: hypothetical protein COT26_01765 [Candidatus Kerfeldbacteria bacterium CG08_land_8_20_14_0_20_43_14]|uniref:Uncharacterized protein n=1 Tax=Candidatus Kerfeldbacteria bacterium CG08_land_8_20_14_0_20_43_14 TaxID=2014246 RepID=A0A2H0YQE5_9BACT|nr:MAG: hypothetical protein COT26_01765 [Candidatus Kerfeldbacteria bacterium CG08_land_8_20_14_0_20_43_14]
MPEPKELAVIIVSWKVKDQLKQCLESIYSLPEPERPGEVFVVDNDSQDSSVEMVENRFSQARLLKNRQNLGFAKANNLAIKLTNRPYILLLNPDTKVYPNAFIGMLKVFEKYPKAGIVGPTLINFDGSIQPSVRNLPSFKTLLAIFLKFRFWWKNYQPLKKYLLSDFDYSKERPVGQVMGAAFLIRKKVIEEIGLLDEAFWIWFEEVDFCARAKKAGWETWYTPAAKITHLGGVSFSKTALARKQLKWFRSVLHYSRKHFTLFQTLILWKAGLIGIVGTWLVEKAKKPVLRFLFIAVLLNVFLGLFTFKVGLLSDDWDFYHEARTVQTDLIRPLVTNVGGAFYRPLSVYSYSVDYAIAPYNTFVARVHEILLIIIAVTLLSLIVWELTKSTWLASAAGVLFSLWPQHLETTAWLSGRPDLLCTIFIFAGILSLVYAIKRKNNLYYFLLPLLSSLAFLSKETGILILPALVLSLLLFKERKSLKPWIWIGMSGIFVGLFFLIRTQVLGVLVGGYGESQMALGLQDLINLVKVLGIGWVNWAYLSSQIGSVNSIKIGLAILEVTGLVICVWYVIKGSKLFWQKFGVVLIYGLLFISLALPMMGGVNSSNLVGTRHLFLVSAPIIMALVLLMEKIPKRNLALLIVALFLGAGWFINLQPWKIASAQVKSLDAQISKVAPQPELDTVFKIRHLPGHFFGSFQWFAKKSLPETLFSIYGRQDLYNASILTPSQFCFQHSKALEVVLSWQAENQHLELEGILPISELSLKADKAADHSLTLTNNNTEIRWPSKELTKGFRSLVISYSSPENFNGILKVQSIEGNVAVFKDPFFKFQKGERNILVSLCDNWAWLDSRENISGLEILRPDKISIIKVKLAEPY